MFINIILIEKLLLLSMKSLWTLTYFTQEELTIDQFAYPNNYILGILRQSSALLIHSLSFILFTPLDFRALSLIFVCLNLKSLLSCDGVRHVVATLPGFVPVSYTHLHPSLKHFTQN